MSMPVVQKPFCLATTVLCWRRINFTSKCSFVIKEILEKKWRNTKGVTSGARNAKLLLIIPLCNHDEERAAKYVNHR